MQRVGSLRPATTDNALARGCSFQAISNRRPFIARRRLFDSDPVPTLGIRLVKAFIEHRRIFARIGGHLQAEPATGRWYFPAFNQNQRSLRTVAPGMQSRRPV